MTADVLPRFCASADEPWRKDLHRPVSCVIDGEPWTAASDGHRLVAVKGKHAEPGEMSHGFSAMAQEATTATIRLDPTPILAMRMPELPPCPNCKGKPRPRKDCTECDGDGECSHCYDGSCPACGGDGYTGGCNTCSDSGKVGGGIPVVVIGGVPFDLRYVQSVLDPEVMGTDILVTTPKHAEPWRMRGAALAVVMPLTKDMAETPLGGYVVGKVALNNGKES